MTELETSRLLLRRWRDEDLDAYARICADPEVMRHLPATLSRRERAEQMAGFVRHWEEHGYGLWAVEERASGGFIGFVGLMYHDDWPEGGARPRLGGGWTAPSGGGASLPRARSRAFVTGSKGSGWSASSASRYPRTPPPGA